MILAAFLALIAIGTFAAFRNWRSGIFWAIVVGMVQDPVRKLTPGAPAIMAISSLPVWVAILLKMRVQERQIWTRIRTECPGVARRMILFVLVLIPAALMAFQYGVEAWRLVVVGLLGYIVPLLAISLGYAYVDRVERLRSLLGFYCVLAAVMMTGSLLEYAGADALSPAIGTEALGMKWVRYAGGGVFDLISGFFRSPDVMGWHAATLTMLALTLVFAESRGRGAAWMAAGVLGATCLLLAGRRKMLLMPVVWLAVVALSQVRAGRVSRVISLGVIAAITVFGLVWTSGEIGVNQDYYDYADSVRTDTTSRLIQSSWGDLMGTYEQTGFLGDGIGTASQGAQHLELSRQKGWQESGLSKLLIELGIPGLVCATVLGFAIAGALLGSLPVTSGRSSMFLLGTIALCFANAASFIVSHQVYGDVLIMALTAFFIGVALAGNRWMTASR